MTLSGIPRVRLAFLPTPIEPLSALTRHLGGPQVWIKRDDMTGLAMGGNKARKLEFLLGEAIERKADTIVTFGAVQSNHCRMTAAAACKLGLKSFLVLSGEKPDVANGNFLLERVMGCEYLFVPDFNDISKLDEMGLAVRDRVQELTDGGRALYMIPAGGSTPLGDVGYYLAAIETCEQARQIGIEIDHMCVAMGTGGTQAGLLAGVKSLRKAMQVIGISVNKEGSNLGSPPIDVMAKQVGKLIGQELDVQPQDVIVHYDYCGEGYGKVTPECVEAIKLVSRLEGIFLDPVYTGKAMAGMIDLIRRGNFSRDETLLFVHTGGYPGIFPYGESLCGQ